MLGEPTLKTIARELVDTVSKNVTIDWTVRTQTVLERAEVLSESWATLVHAELFAEVLAFHHEELRVKFLPQLALPLEREVGRANNEDSFGKTAKVELADEQPCAASNARLW